MNLREFIQSEIKSQLDETVTEAYEVITKDNKKVYISDKDYKRLNAGKDVVGYSYSPEGHTETWVMANYVKSAKPSNDKLAKVVDKYAKFESVNEGIWPKSKLADRFEFILSDELKKNFKGIFYVVGYDLYHNDKKVMTINSDKDSVNSIVKTLKSKLKESVNEGKMPKKYIGNDDIVYLKTKEDSRGAHYNLYYKGHDIDAGGRRFGSEKELKDFAKDYILSNQLYNKLRYADAKPVEEGVMSELDILAKEAKDLKSFIKTVFKEFDNLPKNNETLKWLEGIYKDSKNESVNEEQLDEKLITFSNRAPYGQIVFMAGGAGSGKGFAIDNFIDAAGFKVRDVDEMKKAVANLNRLGKFSVDTWYKKYGNKLSTKPPKNNPDGLSEKEHIEEFFLGKGYSIADIANPKHKSGGLKNPNNVAALHYIVDVMDLKDKWIINMLKGKENKETLPNLLFDITAKNVSSITDVIQPLIEAGYSSKNIHLIWVLTNYDLSIVQNKKRDRVVPDDILLQTHEGAAKTMWGILTQIKPKGLDGRIDVILNNREETVPFKDSNGNVIKVKQTSISGKQLKNTDKFSSDYGKNIDDAIVVKGFKSLPIKKQGGGIVPEKVWKDILFQWIKDNAPKTIDLSQKIGE